MSEQEIREGMRVAVWDEPPLDFDPDALIERAEKVRSRRRALVSVGVGTALVVVSAFSLPMLLTGSRPDSTNVAESPTRSSTPATASNGKRDKIAAAAAGQLRRMLPDVKDVYPEFPDNRAKMVPPAPTQIPSGEMFFIRFEDGIGPTAIQLEFGGTDQYCYTPAMCREEPQADGSKVMLVEQVEGSGIVLASVTHVRKDGKSVTVTAFSHNPVTGQGLRQTVPIGTGGLRQLATDPQIGWD